MTDPIDDTQPHATDDAATAAPVTDAQASDAQTPAASPQPAADADAPAPAAPPPTAPAAHEPSLRANPDAPADSGWREPAWFPPRDRDRGRDRGPGLVAMVVGLGLIAIGAWYFLDRTLGLALPRLSWGSLWPIALIALGGLILIRALQRRA